MTEPLPVQIQIGEQSETHFIEGFEIDHINDDTGHPLRLRLDTGEIYVGAQFADALLRSIQETDDG